MERGDDKCTKCGKLIKEHMVLGDGEVECPGGEDDG